MRCPQCAQENPDGFRFCGSCGVQLGKAPASEERKVVTVLFADLVGFTSRRERMDVEDVRGTLACSALPQPTRMIRSVPCALRCRSGARSIG
jgi:hypothetical protein